MTDNQPEYLPVKDETPREIAKQAMPQTTGMISREEWFLLEAISRGNDKALRLLWCRNNGLDISNAFTGVYTVNGRIGLEGRLIAAEFMRNPNYDYDIVEHNTEVCTVVLHRLRKRTGEWETLPPFSYSMVDDAKVAGLDKRPNWIKYPKNHLFGMCFKTLQSWYAGDLFTTPIYERSELEEIARVIDSPYTVTQPLQEIPPEKLEELVINYGPETTMRIVSEVQSSGRDWEEVVIELTSVSVDEDGEVVLPDGGGIQKEDEQIT